MRNLGFLGVILLTASVHAEVVSSDPQGFHNRHSATVDAQPEVVFTAMTANISHWWDAAHSYSLKGENFSLTMDCFCEQWNGNLVRHLAVGQWIENQQIVMTGGLGPLMGLGLDGAMTWAIKPDGNGKTTITWDYRVHGWYPPGLETLAPVVNQVNAGQFGRLLNYVRTGSATSSNSKGQ